MNKDMLTIINSTTEDRSVFFGLTADKMNVLPLFIEKDFWVCVVLDVMFNDIASEYKEDDLFLFKGGTSLSKCFDKIDRFSEDIDIVVSRQFLGFHGENDPLDPNTEYPSKKKKEPQ